MLIKNKFLAIIIIGVTKFYCYEIYCSTEVTRCLKVRFTRRYEVASINFKDLVTPVNGTQMSMGHERFALDRLLFLDIL